MNIRMATAFVFEGSLSLLTLLFAPGLVSLGVSCFALAKLVLVSPGSCHRLSCSIRLLEGRRSEAGSQGRRPRRLEAEDRSGGQLRDLK